MDVSKLSETEVLRLADLLDPQVAASAYGGGRLPALTEGERTAVLARAAEIRAGQAEPG